MLGFITQSHRFVSASWKQIFEGSPQEATTHSVYACVFSVGIWLLWFEIRPRKARASSSLLNIYQSPLGVGLWAQSSRRGDRQTNVLPLNGPNGPTLHIRPVFKYPAHDVQKIPRPLKYFYIIIYNKIFTFTMLIKDELQENGSPLSARLLGLNTLLKKIKFNDVSCLN